MKVAKKFLIDSNIIIGAERGDASCRRILSAYDRFQLVVTEEVAREVGVEKLPEVVSIISTKVPRQIAAFDPRKTKAYIDKEYGSPGGSRRGLSTADKSIIRLFARDSTIDGIVSNDKRDMEHGLYNMDGLDRRPLVLSAKEFVDRFLR